jgi:hypothetical protein
MASYLLGLKLTSSSLKTNARWKSLSLLWAQLLDVVEIELQMERLRLYGKEYLLETNNGFNHLHGALKGFDKKVWKAKTLLKESEVSLILSYESKDMEEGYPGNLKPQVTYTLK